MSSVVPRDCSTPCVCLQRCALVCVCSLQRSMRVVIPARRFIRRRFFICAAYLVLLSGPGAEVDLLAAVGAERAEAVFRGPADILPASGAFDDGRHTVRQSIGNGTSNEYRGIFRRFKGAAPSIQFYEAGVTGFERLQAAKRELERHVDIHRARTQIAVLHRESHPEHVLVSAGLGNHAQFRCHPYLHQLV